MAGMYSLGTLEPDSSHLIHLMPAIVVVGLGLGLTFVPMTLGALGLAVLSAVALSSADERLPHAPKALLKGAAAHASTWPSAPAAAALAHGYNAAFLTAKAQRVEPAESQGGSVRGAAEDAEPHGVAD